MKPPPLDYPQSNIRSSTDRIIIEFYDPLYTKKGGLIWSMDPSCSLEAVGFDKLPPLRCVFLIIQLVWWKLTWQSSEVIKEGYLWTTISMLNAPMHPMVPYWQHHPYHQCRVFQLISLASRRWAFPWLIWSRSFWLAGWYHPLSKRLPQIGHNATCSLFFFLGIVEVIFLLN